MPAGVTAPPSPLRAHPRRAIVRGREESIRQPMPRSLNQGNKDMSRNTAAKLPASVDKGVGRMRSIAVIVDMPTHVIGES